ncbi:MAG: hypothetical protein HYT36_01785 [Candidatus Staskawiczbacteria bacterium]|nr:hypothetical protein [Candidatus Staskawiczbacteria bacterium]
MVELIALIIFIFSLGGILFILANKIPILAELPQNGGNFGRSKIVLALEEKVKEIYLLFKKQIILHKFLSWVKCLTLRIETKIDSLLHKIRKKAQQIDKEVAKKNNLPK